VESKKWYQSKTLWTNISALVAAVGLFLESGDVSVMFPAGLALVNVILRIVTSTSIEG
jgi:hypothetical protein